MPTITTETTPYELLFRWNDGALAGAHIQFVETIRKDGAVISQQVGHAQPVSMAGEAGFPLADVLSTVQADAVAARDSAIAALAAKSAELTAATEAHTAATEAHTAALAAKDAELATATAALAAALAAKDAELTALRTQVEALQAQVQPPATVNGVPQSAPRKQARQALVLAGLYEQAIAAIAAIPDAQQRMLAQIEWDDSPAYERQSPLVQQVGAALGLSDEQIDNLFVTASTL